MHCALRPLLLAGAVVGSALLVSSCAFSGKPYLIHPAVKGWEPAPLGLHRYQFVRLEK